MIRRNARTAPLAASLTATMAGLALAASALTAPSSAAPSLRASTPAPPRQSVVARHLVSPLSLAVADNGVRYFAQNFTGQLMRQAPGRKPQVVYRAKRGTEVGAVSVRNGEVRFAITGRARAVLMGIGKDGKARGLARLQRFENMKNPDGGIVYGFRFAGQKCLSKLPEEIPGRYPGIVQSHPYATAQAANGTTYVADAAGNTILAVGPKGALRTVAVIRPIVVKVSKQAAEANDLPGCVVGKRYYLESVPTDVEIGPDGMLYVSALPGGPEDGSLGANGAVFRVDPRTGRTTAVVTGLVSPTGIAVSNAGAIYIAELFRGRVARVLPGKHVARTFLSTPLPGDVEISHRDVYFTDNVLSQGPDGRVVRVNR